MNYSVSETAKLTGVSVRTLHYYDDIGLLKPCRISDSGYRYYDDEALLKMQQILFYRELDFSLKDILKIMNSPNYDKEKALARQKELLTLKRKRLERLIDLLDANLKGDTKMSFEEFDMSEIEEYKKKYAQEVEEKWGQSDAYAQSHAKTSKYTKSDWKRLSEKSDAIMKKFAQARNEEVDGSNALAIVQEWKDFITEFYYDCTNEILEGLGQMYVLDERFTKNLDKYGEGTAKFMSESIAAYITKAQ